MSKKSEAAFRKIQDAIGREGDDLSRPEYIEFIGEVLGFVQCLQDCIDDDEGQQ